jgi:GNAT superfamily N-acetyltransferase
VDIDPRQPEFSAALENAEGRAWVSMAALKESRPLFDDRGLLAGMALFGSREHPLMNRVVGLGVDRPGQPELLDRVVEMYDEAGADCVFIPAAPTARPSTLPRMLKQRGFEPAMKEAKLYRRTADPPRKDPRDRVVAAGPEDHEIVLSLYRSGGMQADWAEVVAANLGNESWHQYLAFDGGRPVAVATLFASQGIAYLYPGWTLPAYRHRGYQRALAAHRLQAAAELGCEWASVNLDVTENPIGFTIRSYTRMGFELLYVRTTHIRPRPNVALPSAYSRRMLVPQD